MGGWLAREYVDDYNPEGGATEKKKEKKKKKSKKDEFVIGAPDHSTFKKLTDPQKHAEAVQMISGDTTT